MNIEPTKYYWVSYLLEGRSDLSFEQRVLDTHPFYCVSNYSVTNEGGTTWYSLANWKEISEDEYRLFNDIKKKV